MLSALTASRDEKRALDGQRTNWGPLHDFRFDALVMLGPPVPEPLLSGRLPVVVVGWHVDHPDVDIVRTSNAHGMALAVRHLVDLGHRHIAHLEGGEGLVAAARRDAYVHAMRAHGLEKEIHIIPCGGEDQLDGQRAARTLVEDPSQLPTGIVAFDDDIAAAATSVLAQHGLSVPGDISMVGFDDNVLARSPGVDLTSIQQVPQEMARLAVARVVARCDGSDVADREIVLGPELVVRSTTGPAPDR